MNWCCDGSERSFCGVAGVVASAVLLDDVWQDGALWLRWIGDAVFVATNGDRVVVLFPCSRDMAVEGVTLALLTVLDISDGGGVGVLLSSYR